MNSPTPSESSVKPSAHMIELLNESAVTKRIAVVFPDIERILTQVQLDIVNENNRDTVGPTLLGIKHIQDTLLLFKVKGSAIISQEKQN